MAILARLPAFDILPNPAKLTFQIHCWISLQSLTSSCAIGILSIRLTSFENVSFRYPLCICV